MTLNRRTFLAGAGSLTLLGSPLISARASQLKKRNLVVVMLRGGMDGLTAVPPKDKLLQSARPDIIVKGTISLNSDFALHPKLETFYELWKANQAAIFHATNIPYVNRSHFEGQDLMESGGHTPYGESTGWLGRGMEAAELQGLSVSLPMPLLLRGGINPDNYFPTRMRLPDQALMQRVAATYPEGSSLNDAMQRVLHRPMSMMQRVDDRDALSLAGTAAEELAKEDGPRVAVFDLNGFDTHAAQGGEDGEHGEMLSKFDGIVRILRNRMGNEFNNTLVVSLTEFGRKLEQNGGYGTEHGYGTAVLMAGGLVKSAKVHADWPGLASKNLYDGQDLNATIDARSIYCAAMAACFDVDFRYIRKHAFWDETLSDVTESLFRV